ncbi:hypothetical protein BCR34DRAFT_599900 [Clohesyomyces aquaticus]|uniref:DUF1772-domain-containing protein n=1 Tax=Clohesyomyces aquaticus TaxID=1231657 RepID=A0A1Y1ZSZ2_9PLEO|nr:hypothetical protein BCR34DRAFT_599900 [Clohesyomyces aquaticus]
MSASLVSETITPVLQTYSILALALAAGFNLSSSLLTLPTILPSSPSALATQWGTLFNRGIVPVVTFSMSSAAGFALLAYNTHSLLSTSIDPNSNLTLKRNLYVAAAVGAVSLAPYTQILMGSVNAALKERAARVESGKGSGGEVGVEDTHGLVRQWGYWNLRRGGMLLVGAACGVLGSVL